jgi:hypothetical protein
VQKHMKARNGFLFPLMVLAAGSVTVFGCIGIAAITGYLPLAKATALPMGTPAIVESLEALAPSLNKLEPHKTVVVANTGARTAGDVPVVTDGGAVATPDQAKPGPVPKKLSPQ